MGELQRFSLIQTKADAKGMAYEQLVGANLRGDRGEYFTPRTVCTMAAAMLLATFPQDQWLTIDVLDPAVGTGGFLVALMNVWHDHINGLERNRWGEDDRRVEDETQRRVHDIASTHLFGVDFNPVLVRAAQMNLVMHGDGSTNVYHANTLLPPGEWPEDEPNNVQRNVRMGGFDAILTNPPFGDKIQIDDPHILAQYSLTLGRSSVPPDQLFIERSLQLLRPGGRLAIVLPDSILTNPGLLEVRRWILNHARVIASIDLPVETFQPHTGTQTSVLLLQKKTDQEMAIELAAGRPYPYEVFMAMPRAVGHDRRGNPLYRRTPEGDLIETAEPHSVFRRNPDGNTVVETATRQRRIRHDELPDVARQFQQWVSVPERMRWLNG
ncbi:MAG: N-6 DNA methylase [Chloroflexota bacterium]|nr:N-6 DNA methylase [Chloroflexota bacterium]MDE2959807.1 N-6 DNA methylase [Chloroflexota bacterium]